MNTIDDKLNYLVEHGGGSSGNTYELNIFTFVHSGIGWNGTSTSANFGIKGYKKLKCEIEGYVWRATLYLYTNDGTQLYTVTFFDDKATRPGGDYNNPRTAFYIEIPDDVYLKADYANVYSVWSSNGGTGYIYISFVGD